MLPCSYTKHSQLTCPFAGVWEASPTYQLPMLTSVWTWRKKLDVNKNADDTNSSPNTTCRKTCTDYDLRIDVMICSYVMPVITIAAPNLQKDKMKMQSNKLGTACKNTLNDPLNAYLYPRTVGTFFSRGGWKSYYCLVTFALEGQYEWRGIQWSFKVRRVLQNDKGMPTSNTYGVQLVTDKHMRWQVRAEAVVQKDLLMCVRNGNKNTTTATRYTVKCCLNKCYVTKHLEWLPCFQLISIDQEGQTGDSKAPLAFVMVCNDDDGNDPTIIWAKNVICDKQDALFLIWAKEQPRLYLLSEIVLPP